MLQQSPHHPVVGLVEELTPFQVKGWAFDRSNPRLAVDLALWVDGQVICRFRPQAKWDVLAQKLRLAASDLGPVAFSIELPTHVADGQSHTVQVRVAQTGTALKCSASEQVQFQNPHVPQAALPGLWFPKVKRSAQQTGVDTDRQARSAQRPLVTVVVLNRNGAPVLNALLTSWRQHNRAVPAEWVVIDHNSSDDSLQMLAGWRERIPLRVKALKVNDSFSASCNRGAQLARTPYLLFLNNDLIWQQDALPAMLEALNQPGVGAVGMKLLKVVPDLHGTQATEVQHLGVRFVQHDSGYWPFEITPRRDGIEQEHACQDTPAVTGAALLCRKADFDAVGGFHTAYFYGFEDVEFCLRLSQRLGLRVVCRNDVLALHHHGHTRLTGREMAVTDRLVHNARVLDEHMGLWAKVAWWHSLATADRHMHTEPLTIGLQVTALPAPFGQAEDLTQRFRSMASLAKHLQWQWPHAQIVWLHNAVNPHWAKGLHVLVVSDPDFDIRRLESARADLRCVAWVADEPTTWADQAWWTMFDSRVAASLPVLKAAQRATGIPVFAGWKTAYPLGPRTLATGDSMLAAWRVEIKSGTHFNEASPDTDRETQAANALQMMLQAGGVACFTTHLFKSVPAKNSRVVEVCIWVMHGAHIPPAVGTIFGETLGDAEGMPVPQGHPMEMSVGTLNVWWWIDGQAHEVSGAGGVEPDLVVCEAPSMALLQEALESRIGRTFFAP
jgi:GT2 family glycosyltransferase